MKEMLIVSQPADRPGHHQQSKNDERWSNSTPQIPVPRQRECNDAPYARAENPTIVASVDSRQHEDRNKNQAPSDYLVTSRADRRHTFQRQQSRPDQERKKKRLCHRRGREIKPIRVQCIEESCCKSPTRYQQPTCKPINPGNARDVTDQRWPRACKTVLPPLQFLH